MAKRIRFISIKTKMIVLFLLVFIVPIMIMFFNSYISTERLLIQKYTSLLIDISQQSNIRIEEYLNEVKQISLVSSYGNNSYVSAGMEENYPVQNFLRDDSLRHENEASRLFMDNVTMKDRTFSVYLYNLAGGKDLFISSNKAIDYNYDPRAELWLQSFIESDQIVTNLSTRRDLQTRDGDWAILHVRKVFDLNNGDLLGIVVFSIDIEFVHKVIERLQQSNRFAFTVVNEEHQVMYNRDETQIGKPVHEVIPVGPGQDYELMPGGQIVDHDKKKYIIIKNPLQEHSWTTYLYMPLDEVSVEGEVLKKNLILIAFVLLFFAIISTFYLSNLITRPIKKLMRNMMRVEKGDFDNLPLVHSNDEIGLLGKRFEQMSEELKLLVARIYKEEEEKTDAEIRALQAQINPHFLYNTLNSVKWIASMQGSGKIVEMIESLISLLRYSAQTADRLVTIRQELESVNHYITIQKVRYYNKISVVYEVDESMLDCKILKFTLQPIVENAIFHGIADHEEEGVITIKVYGHEECAWISIEDNGKGMDKEAIEQLQRGIRGKDSKFTGIGIRNVHQRIQRMFGTNYGIQFESEEKVGTVFLVKFPKING